MIALIVNVAVVAYLLYAKRLFGMRGGAAADETMRERDGAGPRSSAARPRPAPGWDRRYVDRAGPPAPRRSA